MKKELERKLERCFYNVPLYWISLFGDGGARAKEKQKKLEAETAAEAAGPFTPVLRFAVASDVHISADDPRNADRLAALFRSAYRYADADAAYPRLDAVLLVGDTANSGSDAEYEVLKRVIAENKRDGTQMITVMGNHEFARTGHEGYVRHMGEPLDKHRVVNGFHFIGLSPDPKDTWHTVRQVRWMRRELKKAAQDAPKKPIFTMQHGHIWKTVYVSRSWYTQMSALLHAVYARYPQVINFSGHSHGPVNNPISVWQKKYTLFGTGTLNYFEMERDIGDETVPAGSENAAQYYIVEADAADRVRVLPYNLLTDDFFRTPANAGAAAGRRLTYFIPAPADRSRFAYTSARRKSDGVPAFDADARITVRKTGDGAAEVSFPQARDEVCVYGYRITAAETLRPKKPVAVKELYSEYYFEPMPGTCGCTLTGLLPGREYTVCVTPLNVWRRAGGAIRETFVF